MEDFNIETWEKLCHEAECLEASDLHIAAGQPVFLRVDGELRRLELPFPSEDFLHGLIEKIASEKQLAYLNENRELDFSWTFGERRFRINAFYQQGKPALACRLIPKSIPTLEDIGAPRVFERLLAKRHGLILVCGATGSGKTTTLAAFLNTINRTRSEHILTLEDPVEFIFSSDKSLVQQRSYGEDFFSFAGAVKSSLRENPDILLVGELRDADAVAAALHAAETGVLVLASLHTHTAAEAVIRLEGFFHAAQQDEIRMQLSLVLEAVITQQLLPAKTGGRVAASEVLCATPAVRSLIRSGKVQQLETIMMAGSKEGMQTMGQAIEKLAVQGKLAP